MQAQHKGFRKIKDILESWLYVPQKSYPKEIKNQNARVGLPNVEK